MGRANSGAAALDAAVGGRADGRGGDPPNHLGYVREILDGRAEGKREREERERREIDEGNVQEIDAACCVSIPNVACVS